MDVVDSVCKASLAGSVVVLSFSSERQANKTIANKNGWSIMVNHLHISYVTHSESEFNISQSRLCTVFFLDFPVGCIYWGGLDPVLGDCE